MKKKVLPLVLTAAMALCAVPAMADDAVEVMSTTQAVTVNGEKVDFEGKDVCVLPYGGSVVPLLQD